MEAVEFTLPDVAEGLADAEIVRWWVDVGDPVRLDETFIEIETDKAVVELPAPVTGVLARRGAEEGDVVRVGALLAVFAPEGSSVDAVAAKSASAPALPSVPAFTTEETQRARKPRATPATRRLARELGVDLADVVPSGEAGRIMDADVRATAEDAGSAVLPPSETLALPPTTDSTAARARRPAPAVPVLTPLANAADMAVINEDDVEIVPLRGLRRATARTMTQSWTTVPHVNSIHEVDFSALRSLRAELTAGGKPIPTTAFLVRAAALALREFPSLNATVDAETEQMTVLHRRHLGVAIDAPDGLIVPVVADADRKSVSRIGAELVALAAAASARSLGPEQLRGGTFTLNNYGPLGGWFGTSLVKPPEVGICSFGPIRDQVVPREGEIVIRPVGVMTLAADHRVADGSETIGFCLAVRELLEAPLRLLVTD